MDIEESKIVLKDFQKGKIEKDKLEHYRGSYKMGYFYTADIQEAIETVLSELEKKEAIINEMTNIISAIMTGITAIQNQFEEEYCEFIKSDEDCCWKTEKKCTDCIKEYFTKKVEGK